MDSEQAKAKIDIFNITELQKRRAPKKDQSFELKLYGKRATQVDEGEGEEGDREQEKKQQKVVFKDKRKSSTNLVDRELILKRLKMTIPVEKILISQAPVQIEKEQVKKRVQVSFDEDSELHDEMKRLAERSEDEKIAEVVEEEIEEAIQDGTEKSIDEDALIPIQDTVTQEDEDEDEDQEKGKGKGKGKKDTVKKPRGKKKVADFVAEAPIDLTIAKIGKSLVMDRLPKRQKVKMGVSSYYMNNRKLFIDQLSKMFKPYRDKIAANAGEISCKTARNDAIDFELLSHQLVVRDYLNLYTPYRGLLLYHGLGSGKCHAKGTPIIMADGTIKLIENIQVGDLLMGDDSQPRSVLSLARGRDKMYNVIPIKGEKYTVNQEHILCLRASGFPKLSHNTHKATNTNYNIQWLENNTFCSKTFTFNNNSDNEKDMKESAELFFKNILSNPQTNDNVFEISIKDYLLLSDKKKAFLKGYKVPIEFLEKDIPIDPYMIGYWLGDGTSSTSAITCQDSSVLYYYANNLKQYNLSLNYHSGYTYGISGNGKYNNNIFLNTLKDLHMLNDKHIPTIYKYNSRENRLKLLAGLLDSDGSYDTQKHCFEFTQKNECFMDDVIYLARSLGFACYKAKKNTSWTYNGIVNNGSAFRITISGKGIEEIPTLIPRKKAVPRKQIKDVLVTGIKIEYANEDDYYGFMLDGNCRYLMGDFTVTHNTCTSIGIAEGMKTGKSVVLMTPASLKMNFFSELKKCGDTLYKKNQFWEFISIKGEPQNVRILVQSLGLGRDYITEHGGAWMVDITKASNFAQLSDSDQKSVDEQLNAMIRNKYQDINYNGLNANKMDELTNTGKKNPFDNKVVIIDEAHNLVSRIANAGSKKESIAGQLYKFLMDATNAKIVFLTGTPIINTPREISILFNMLRGYIKTWTFQLQINTAAKINRDTILEYFRDDGLGTYDFVDYSGDKLTVTRNPFGFVNIYTRSSKKGGKRTTMKKTKKENNIKPRVTKKIYENENMDTESTDESELYQREREHEYNKVNQVDLYEGGGTFEDYSGVKVDEMGNISDAEFQKQVIRILDNNGISVVGKPKIVKELALPDDKDLFYELFINNEKGEVMNTDLLKRRILGLTSYFRSAQEQLLPSFVKDEDGSNYHIVNIDMSSHQFDLYKDIRKDERDDEARKKKKRAKKRGQEDEDDKLTSTYRIYSRSVCNFAFPSENPRPMLRIAEDEDIDINAFNGLTEDIERAADDYFEEAKAKGDGEEKQKLRTLNKSEYQQKIKDAYDFLTYNPARQRDHEYLRERELANYSPKFVKILENIKNRSNKGLHLLYSQFRTLEGIGIFKLVLEANGFIEFKISKKGGEWIIENSDVDPEKPRFVLYTGTETAEEKEIVRNIYNSAWEFVPPSIVSVLKEQGENNFFGEIIKVLMITSSGAEGINLRNTRFVHIMEPYWNMVRVDQVVGRARRICSHEDLPEDMRTVQVFIYISQVTEEQLSKNIEMRTNDISKLKYQVLQKSGDMKMEHIPFTTDQYLFEIAQIKDSINRQILTAVKETAIDCSLYNNNPDEPLVCYGFGKVSSNNFGSYPILEVDRSQKPEMNVKAVKQVLVSITVDEIKYAMDKATKVVYDFESYKKAKDKTGELITVGIFDERTKKIISK
jgi:hypothetical protein